MVIVALDDPLLRDFHKRIQEEYPKQEFRAVGVDLGGDDYMPKIVEATTDLDIALLFNNAGFITIGVRASYYMKMPYLAVCG